MGKIRSSKRKPKTLLEFQISSRSGAFHLLWGRQSWGDGARNEGRKRLLRFPPYTFCGNSGAISGWGWTLKRSPINREGWKKNWVEISENDWEDTEIGLWVIWSTDTQRCASSFCMTQKQLNFWVSIGPGTAWGAMPLSTTSKSWGLVKLKLRVIN